MHGGETMQRGKLRIERMRCDGSGKHVESLVGRHGVENDDSWKNDSSAYCRIPRGGSYPSWRPSRQRCGVLRARKLPYPLSFSWLGAFVVRRRSSRCFGQLSECRRDADAAKFPDNREQCRGCDSLRLHEVCVRVSGWFRAKSHRATIRISRSFACGTSALHGTCTDVHRCVVLHNQRRRQRLSDIALSSLVVKMVRSDDTLISFRRSVKILRSFNTISRE